MRRSKTPKLRVTGLYEGKSPVTGEFPAQKTSNAESVSIWWRHHDPGTLRLFYSLQAIWRSGTTQIAMIQRSASVQPAHGNERASAGAPPAFRPRVRYKLDRSKPRRLPSRVTLAHRRRNWHTSALKAGRLPARVPPAWRQRPLTMENVSALSRESRDSNASLVTAVTAWRVGVC